VVCMKGFPIPKLLINSFKNYPHSAKISVPSSLSFLRFQITADLRDNIVKP
jgi:hypothetical protein